MHLHGPCDEDVLMIRRFVLLVSLLGAATAFAQDPIELDESCTVTVGNQTAIVRPDGTFLVPNISVFQSRDTGLAPQLYRVRATCLREGEAITGQSEFFELTPGETTFIADVLPSELDPIPTSISVSAPGDNLGPGASLQLTVLARFADGTTEDRTFRADGTTYLSTNPNLLTVTEDGIVTGQNTGTSAQTGTIAVLNEGNLGTINITAVPDSNDLDGDGMPNDYEDLFGLNKFFNDANLDLDSDGLTNIQEFELGTLPNNPDTDADGIIDGLDGDPLHPEESPPTIAITSPTDGDTLIEGQTILFSVDASDDGLLVSVELSTDTSFSETFADPPFETDFVVPVGVTQIVFSTTATDSVPNVSTASVTTSVIPDPLTTVIGSVVDPDDLPVEGATLITNGDLSGTSLPDGSFSIPDVPTILGDIVVEASATIDDRDLTGQSDPLPPVLGGITDVGLIQISAFVPIGMVVDNSTDSVIVFDTDTDAVLGSVPIGPGTIGDCAITADGTLGFATDFALRIWVIDLTTSPPSLASGTNPIPISNFGEDVSITPDQQFLVVCDGSATQPVSVVDIATRTQISTFATGSDCNSVDVCADGSVLVTSFNNANVRRLIIDSFGNITDTGEVLGTGGQPNNAFCAPEGTSGLVVTRGVGELRSFTLPGLAAVHTRSLSGSFGISGLVDSTAARVFVRSNSGAVDVFDYESATGILGAAPSLTIPIASTPTFFGMDQMALHPNGIKLYVSQPGALNVYDATTGALLTSITDPSIVSPTGVCFPTPNN